MHASLATLPGRRLAYDAAQRRVWIMGQRCHHGATGAVLALAGVSGLTLARARGPAVLGLAAAGSLLMAHDWKDRALWFRPGDSPAAEGRRS
jgi:hypothetical protein